MITTWLILLDCDALGLSEECILVLGDNTSAIGWLFHSGKILMASFYYEAVQFIAHKLAKLLTASTHTLASQYLKGEKNMEASQEEPHPLMPDNPSDGKGFLNYTTPLNWWVLKYTTALHRGFHNYTTALDWRVLQTFIVITGRWQPVFSWNKNSGWYSSSIPILATIIQAPD
jgi:hypothetical protein